MLSFIDLPLSNLNYHIFPSKRFSGSTFSGIHDETFNFFVRRWEEAFGDTKEDAKPAPGWEDHFLRQDLVSAISFKDKIIAAHLYTIYDLSAAATLKSEYFKFISPLTISNLSAMAIKNVISMEYLCVDKDIKFNSLGVSIGKVILGLGGKLSQEKGIDGAIGTPIKNNKVDLMMKNVGGFVIEKDILKYGYPVDLLFIPTKPCSKSCDPKVDFIMENLWSRRNDHTGEFYRKISA